MITFPAVVHGEFQESEKAGVREKSQTTPQAEYLPGGFIQFGEVRSERGQK